MDVVISEPSLLGESPVWSVADQALIWCDIHRPAILRSTLDGAPPRVWPMAETIGSIGLRPGGLVLALRTGFGLFDAETGSIEPLAHPIAGRENLRFNDGRVDRRGRFWAGTVQEKRVPGEAALYRLDPDGGCREMASGFTVANGTAWSPDDRTMYFADSWAREVYAFDFDIDDGAIANRRVFARLAEDEGVPDGATVDVDGCYWVAHFDGGRITRFRPDGGVDRVIAMPVPRPTSCCFGGPGLATLFVTSASYGLSDEQSRAAPLSGCVFALDVGTSGLPDPIFGQPLDQDAA